MEHDFNRKWLEDKFENIRSRTLNVLVQLNDQQVNWHRERIFDPFYTVSSDRSRVHGGTGLGLSLVRNLAEKQQGSVKLVESGPGGLRA